MFVDDYAPAKVVDPSLDHATTLAQGLANAKHRMELVGEGDAPIPIRAIRVYQPPVK